MNHLPTGLAFCLIALNAVPAGAAAPNALEQEIATLEKDSNEAYAANNLPRYFGYYAEDAVLIFYNKRTTVPDYHKLWIESVKTDPVDSVKLSDMAIRMMPGNNLAIASYQIDVRTRHPGGKFTDEHAFETDVWAKQPAGWKLTHVHYSVTPDTK